MNEIEFVNRLKQFIADRAPESGEYQISRRYEGQMERSKGHGIFDKVLVVLDTTADADMRADLCRATVAAVKGKRDLFHRITYCTWDGKAMSSVGTCRLNQLEKMFAETAASEK